MEPKIVKYIDGYSEIWQNDDGRYHRLDGPAMIFYYESGYNKGQIRKHYYINGKKYFPENDEEFLKIVKLMILK